MAFALVSAQAYGVEAEEPLNERYKQVLILQITAANTDIDLDLGDYAGTFWGTVDGSEPGDTALKAIKDIQTRAATLVTIGGNAIRGKFQVATATNAGEYSVSMNGTNTNLPDILWDSGDAPTAYYIVLEWVLKPGQVPVAVSA